MPTHSCVNLTPVSIPRGHEVPTRLSSCPVMRVTEVSNSTRNDGLVRFIFKAKGVKGTEGLEINPSVPFSLIGKNGIILSEPIDCLQSTNSDPIYQNGLRNSALCFLENEKNG